MKVIVFGAAGLLGQWTWKAALEAHHDVTALVRSPEKLDTAHPLFENLTVIQGDVMDADTVTAASEGRDVAINCTSPAGGNSTLALAKSIVGNAAEAGIDTFYMVGGLGALWVPESNQTQLVQDWDDASQMVKYGLPPDIPKENIRAMTKGHLESMAFMQSTGFAHTFICPGMMLDGPATSSCRITLDEAGGNRMMSVNFGDVAKVIVDDLGWGKLLGHRVCVSAS
ncbi:MAG: NAD(P)H-binding protein [Pseudomonadota bacterium]